MSADELQERVCRCCDRTYSYPVPKSLATRFYCETCSQLDGVVRGLLETYNKRLRRLSREVQTLREQLGNPAAKPGRK